MKYINILLSLTLIGTTLPAMTAKVKEARLVKGTTIGKYAKPGAPVDIRYTSEHVEVGDVSMVDVILISSAEKGLMTVNVNVDKGLNELSHINKHLSFSLTKRGEKHPLHLEVSADEDGLYYVKLLVGIKGKGMRAFAVPVYVGTGKVTKHNTNIEKTKAGNNISVSKAEETIRH